MDHVGRGAIAHARGQLRGGSEKVRSDHLGRATLDRGVASPDGHVGHFGGPAAPWNKFGSTHAADHATLAREPGPPVRALFKYLGVDQQAGGRREGRVVGERVAGAAERLLRCSALAVGIHQFASGLPATLYGIGQSAWPLHLMAVARRGALRAVVRSSFRAAVQAYSALMAQACRDDVGAWAVLAPWRFLHGAVDARLSADALLDLLVRGCRRAGRWLRPSRRWFWPGCGWMERRRAAAAAGVGALGGAGTVLARRVGGRAMAPVGGAAGGRPAHRLGGP